MAFLSPLFLAGAMTARLGIRAVTKGHEYYRRAIYKKTLLETMLGLHHPLDDHDRRTARADAGHDAGDGRGRGCHS